MTTWPQDPAGPPVPSGPVVCSGVWGSANITVPDAVIDIVSPIETVSPVSVHGCVLGTVIVLVTG